MGVLKCILYRHSHCANRLDAEHIFENRRLDLVFLELLVHLVADLWRQVKLLALIRCECVRFFNNRVLHQSFPQVHRRVVLFKVGQHDLEAILEVVNLVFEPRRFLSLLVETLAQEFDQLKRLLVLVDQF